MRRLALAALVVAVSCGGDAGALAVERTGFSDRDGGLGVAALLRNDGDRTVTDVPITITFLHGDDRTVEHSTLPFCPARSDCWWAESYTTAGRADRVSVTAGVGTPTDEDNRVVELSGRRANRRGVVVEVVMDGDAPRWGRFVRVDGGPVPAGVRPEHGERVRRFLYSGVSVDEGEPAAD